jgi:NADH-quinone oxidoreductase subunit A
MRARADLTAALTRRYYSRPHKMSESYLNSYAPLLIHILVAMALSAALILVSTLIGYRRPSRTKLQAYECGIRPSGDAREPFAVKFYLVAMVFILFDVEAIFLYPWALVFRDLRLFGFLEMLLYILILLAGYVYLWKKGALDWNR